MLSFLPDPDTQAFRDRLTDLIFEAKGDVRPYLLIDAAADPSIHIHLDAFPEAARCLFDGETGEQLSDVGPWLAKPERHGDLWEWFLDECWGRNSAVIVRTSLPMARLKQHLKKFLRVQRDDGHVMFFKFYRPAHLRSYMPAFDDDQRIAFMKGIDAWFAETEEGAERLVLDAEGHLRGDVQNFVKPASN
ncbi:DUF4123 domain-containing protein [Marivita sp. S0852]|uniref:DUF4123 domain-containing protein n=1 Tax=Marivita sp. S0852 TaxID=3373893 RepID=UPI0039829A10